jgi:hypothetical protein
LTPSGSYDELDEDDDIEYDDDGLPIKRPTRRSTRNKHKNTSEQLPFSPKKTRRVVLTVTDDDEDGVGSGMKKTTRSRQLKLKLKPMKYKDDEEYGGESEVGVSSDEDKDDDDDTYGGRRLRKRHPSKQIKKGKSRKPKGPKPQYGSVRSIDDIDLDYFSDDEDKPLRAHRMACEKCHDGPSNRILAAWKKRKGKKKRARSDEDEENEEDRAERLGGWVQWYVFFFHF